MVFKRTDLESAELAAMDGPIGEVADLFFDDQHWTMRYLVVDTGGWLSGRQVLISPQSVSGVDIPNRRVMVTLTRTQVQESPDVDTHQPISRRQERALLGYYGLTPYWFVPLALDPGAVPMPIPARPEAGVGVEEALPPPHDPDDDADAHLHSMRDVTGYQIQARDGDIGHVDDFLADDQSWTIRWIVVDTGNWLPGKKVLVSPEWAEAVAWSDRALRVGLTREQIQNAPEYDPAEPLRREYEVRLFEYYGRPSYWEDAA